MIAADSEPLALLREAVRSLSAEQCEQPETAGLLAQLEQLRRQIDLLEAELVRRVDCLESIRSRHPDLPLAALAPVATLIPEDLCGIGERYRNDLPGRTPIRKKAVVSSATSADRRR